MLVTSRPSVAVGIDLGTTFSCVGVHLDGKVHIVPSSLGERTVPSYVFVSPTDLHSTAGHAARDRAHLCPSSTVFDSKRLIGRRFDDEQVQRDRSVWPFKVVPAPDNSAAISLPRGPHGERELFSPQQISALVLAHLKEAAQSFVGDTYEVTEAVITVPAYFSDAQRAATKQAGQLAGLNVLRIINEPTAAALAYGLQAKLSELPGEHNVLIFDLGGGTFDVSLLSIELGVFEVKATAGDTHLGGEDFDHRLMTWTIAQLQSVFGDQLVADERFMRKVRTTCELAKRELSTQHSTLLVLEGILPPNIVPPASLPPAMQIKPLNTVLLHLTRKCFEDLCEDLFSSTLEPVEQVLRDSKIAAFQVDEIVLVGGSTRIPRVQQLLRSFFNDKVLNNSIDPDEAVAFGAALQAAMLTGAVMKNDLSSVLLIDVAPLSLGVEVAGGLMNTLIARNSTIPCRRVQTFTTHCDFQSHVSIQVYEGERVRTNDNLLLGCFELGPLPRAEAGKLQIEVCFSVSVDGILGVTATESSTSQRSSILVCCKDRISSCPEGQDNLAAIMHRLADSVTHADNDQIIHARETSRIGLESFLLACRRRLRDDRSRWTELETLAMENKLTEVEQWMAQVSQEDECSLDASIFERQQAELEIAIMPYFTCAALQKVQERLLSTKLISTSRIHAASVT